MRYLQLMTLILGATLISGAIAAAAATPPGTETAVVELTDKTLLGKAVLQGKYIFVHDDSKTAKSEPCLFVYEYSQDQAGQPQARPEKLVASFHCQAVQHEKASQVVLTYAMTSSGMLELREIQFAGSAEGHRVP